MYYFLANINNKFINNIKIEVGFLLNISETSLSVIETLVNTRLIIKKEIIQR